MRKSVKFAQPTYVKVTSYAQELDNQFKIINYLQH